MDVLCWMGTCSSIMESNSPIVFRLAVSWIIKPFLAVCIVVTTLNSCVSMLNTSGNAPSSAPSGLKNR